jgi:hypothetical protein
MHLESFLPLGTVFKVLWFPIIVYFVRRQKREHGVLFISILRTYNEVFVKKSENCCLIRFIIKVHG